MKCLVAVVAFAPISTVLAAALAQREAPKLITIVHQVSKTNQETAIDVWDYDHTKILAHSCSSSLQSGLFEHDPIAFQVNEHGAGNFTLGSQSFAVSDNPDLNQAASCTRIASSEELIITCHVPFAVGSGVAALDKRGLDDCFPEGGPLELLSVAEGLESGAQDEPSTALTHVATNVTTASDAPASDSNVDKRQNCEPWYFTERVGNGNPHQNPWNVQVSDPMECPWHVGCSITHVTSHHVGWQADFGAVFQWISAGFAVQQSVETGNLYQCVGQPSDYFAVWKKVGTTAYTVKNKTYQPCNGQTYDASGNYIIWSPNSQGRGTWWYCVYSRQYVRWNGDRWLDTSPNQPGGP